MKKKYLSLVWRDSECCILISVHVHILRVTKIIFDRYLESKIFCVGDREL